GEQPVAERPTAAPSKPALHRPAPPAAAPDAAGASDASGRPAGGGISWTVAPVGGEPAAPAAPAVPDELRTAVADEPALPWHPTHADGTERYGEAVVRERLSARFVGETPRDDEPELPAVPPPGGGAFDPDAPNDADAPDDYEAPPEE
ncbi:MAG: hypothetical protein GXX90_07055, partial [Microbacteriaceae bacterium]|nr:hypothetical protein [Microbacteriaceae bacterium]